MLATVETIRKPLMAGTGTDKLPYQIFANDVGMQIEGKPPLVDLKELAFQFGYMSRMSAWGIAQLAVYTEQHHGEKWGVVMEMTGKSPRVISNYVSTHNAIPYRYRISGRSMSWHTVVQKFGNLQNYPEGYRLMQLWLSGADERDFNRDTFRDALKEAERRRNLWEIPDKPHPMVYSTPKTAKIGGSKALDFDGGGTGASGRDFPLYSGVETSENGKTPLRAFKGLAGDVIRPNSFPIFGVNEYDLVRVIVERVRDE